MSSHITSSSICICLQRLLDADTDMSALCELSLRAAGRSMTLQAYSFLEGRSMAWYTLA
jgi:hypothetical protein